MNETTRHAPGTFCWPELATHNTDAAKKFYGGLFGWTAVDEPAGPDMVYTMLLLEGKAVAALHAMNPKQYPPGVPPHFLSYISSANVDASLEKAKSLGGNVVMGPFDVMDAGRMGVVTDPTGAAFGIWQSNKNIGAQLVDQAGTLVWTELMSTDADKSRDFFAKLFDWGTEIHDMGPMKYTVFKRGEQPAGGLMQITPDMGATPSNWLPYFGSNDVDASAAKAKSLGGTVMMEPMDVPHVGRFSVIQDGQGAVFGVAKFIPR